MDKIKLTMHAFLIIFSLSYGWCKLKCSQTYEKNKYNSDFRTTHTVPFRIRLLETIANIRICKQIYGFLFVFLNTLAALSISIDTDM